ncbi:hypothetical protein E5D57_002504 [Metarhizium anisopliae]|nr:hypothetical protein E5D57_002504 [Metarhizium anisopliae]
MTAPEHPPFQERICKLFRKEDPGRPDGKIHESKSDDSNYHVLKNSGLGNKPRLCIARPDVSSEKMKGEFEYFLLDVVRSEAHQRNTQLGGSVTELTKKRQNSDDNRQSNQRTDREEHLGRDYDSGNHAV